ncbi:hypothetical protein DFH09DRAFT_1084523 [Mycena vulgaris]|nr:hypothetical protein DFH09DRAFT_1084523 [Mycena vulgaris]
MHFAVSLGESPSFDVESVGWSLVGHQMRGGRVKLKFDAFRRRFGGRRKWIRIIGALENLPKLVHVDPVVGDERMRVGGDVGRFSVSRKPVSGGRTCTVLQNAVITSVGRLLINLWSAGACFEGIGRRFSACPVTGSGRRSRGR